MKCKPYPSVLTASLLLALWPVAGESGQNANSASPDAAKAALQGRVEELKQSLAANQKALHHYTWVETTEISLKGEVKKTEKKKCSYGSDGKVIKTDLAGAAPAPAPKAPPNGGGRRAGHRGGALKEKVIENKIDDLKEYMGDVAALVKQYVPPDPAKIQAAAQAGKVALDKLNNPGVAQLAIPDYHLPGDKLVVSFNSATKQLAAVNVNSYLGREKDIVTLAVRFASLPDAVNYPAETLLTASAKQIQVKIHNSEYKKE